MSAVLGTITEPEAQADDVEKVALVPFVVAAGCTSAPDIGKAFDVHPRQGGYYGSAAARLGLVEKTRHGHSVVYSNTSAGARLADLVALGNTEAVTAELVTLLRSDPMVEILDDEDGVKFITAEIAEMYADSTVERRVTTYVAWHRFCERHDRTALVDQVAATAAIRAPQVVAERAAARAAETAARAAEAETLRAAELAAIRSSTCPNCYCQMQAKHACI